MSVETTKRMFFNVNDVDVPAQFKNPNFFVYSMNMDKAPCSVIAYIFGERHCLILDEQFSPEERQEKIRDYWLEQFWPSRMSEIEFEMSDAEEKSLKNEYIKLYRQIEKADDPQLRHKLLLDLDNTVCGLTFFEAKNFYLAGLNDGINLKAG